MKGKKSCPLNCPLFSLSHTYLHCVRPQLGVRWEVGGERERTICWIRLIQMRVFRVKQPLVVLLWHISFSRNAEVTPQNLEDMIFFSLEIMKSKKKTFRFLWQVPGSKWLWSSWTVLQGKPSELWLAFQNSPAYLSSCSTVPYSGREICMK